MKKKKKFQAHPARPSETPHAGVPSVPQPVCLGFLPLQLGRPLNVGAAPLCPPPFFPGWRRWERDNPQGWEAQQEETKKYQGQSPVSQLHSRPSCSSSFASLGIIIWGHILELGDFVTNWNFFLIYLFVSGVRQWGLLKRGPCQELLVHSLHDLPYRRHMGRVSKKGDCMALVVCSLSYSFPFVCVLVAQLCLTLCDPMDCTPPASSIQKILWAKILEWVEIPFSRGSLWPRNWIWVFCIAGRFFTVWATRGASLPF